MFRKECAFSVPHVAPVTIYPRQLETSRVTVGEQNRSTYVTQKCQICEQVLYDNHIISEKQYTMNLLISLKEFAFN